MDTNANEVVGGFTSSLENTPQFVTDHIVGTGSLRLDGNSSIKLNTNAVLQNETFACTLSFWFKPERTNGIQVLYDEGGSQYGFAVRLNGSTLQAAVSSNSVVSTVFTHSGSSRTSGTLRPSPSRAGTAILACWVFIATLAPLSTPTRPAKSRAIPTPLLLER